MRPWCVLRWQGVFGKTSLGLVISVRDYEEGLITEPEDKNTNINNNKDNKNNDTIPLSKRKNPTHCIQYYAYILHASA